MIHNGAGRQLRGLDLFCGAGGSSMGARAAGVEMVAAFDHWPAAADAYQRNFPAARVWVEPIEALDPHSVKAAVGSIDLILASPECTNHSPAKGRQPRCERSRETAFQVVRFAAVFEPRWIVIENVMQMRRWHRYEELMAALRGLGYKLDDQVLNAADFGVPQTRRRLFVMCDRVKQPPKVMATGSWVPASTVVNPNGRYSFTPLRREGRAVNTLARADRGIAEVGPDAPFLVVYYGSDGGGGWQRLDTPLRTITTLDRFALVKPTADGHVMRMLQPDELKAAMGMDPDAQLAGTSRREQVRMLGNAVCPPAMAAVVASLTGSQV